MQSIPGPFIQVEAAYRAERIRADYGTSDTTRSAPSAGRSTTRTSGRKTSEVAHAGLDPAKCRQQELRRAFRDVLDGVDRSRTLHGAK